MQIRKLDVELQTFGSDKGKYRGKISFGNQQGEVALKLSDAELREIFKICAGSLVKTVSETASIMVRDIESSMIDQVPAAGDNKSTPGSD